MQRAVQVPVGAAQQPRASSASAKPLTKRLKSKRIVDDDDDDVEMSAADDDDSELFDLPSFASSASSANQFAGGRFKYSDAQLFVAQHFDKASWQLPADELQREVARLLSVVKLTFVELLGKTKQEQHAVLRTAKLVTASNQPSLSDVLAMLDE